MMTRHPLFSIRQHNARERDIAAHPARSSGGPYDLRVPRTSSGETDRSHKCDSFWPTADGKRYPCDKVEGHAGKHHNETIGDFA